MNKQHKHIIKVNRKELSSKHIREKENLEGILNSHRKLTKRPIYRQKKFYFVLFLILLITFLIYYSEKPQEQQEITIEKVLNH